MRAPIVVILMIAAIVAATVAVEAGGQETAPLSSLSMSRATALALEKNHGLMAAVQRTRGSGARVHQAVAAFLPALNFSSTYIRAAGGRTFPMHFHPPGAPFEDTAFFDIAFVPEKLHETKFQLNQPIFTGGRLYNQLKLAKADKRYFTALESSATQDLILEVRRAYMDLLETRESRGVMEEALELAKENVRSAEQLTELGKAAKSDLLRARVRKATAEQDLLVARNNAMLALESLSSILDTGLKEEVELEEVTVDDGLEVPSIEECVTKALERTPDIEAAQRAYERSSAALGIAKGGFLPSISIQADYGWTEEKYRFEESAWAVYTILNFDIFRGTNRFAQVSEASAQKEEARELLEDTKRGSVLRVKQVHYSLQEAAGRRNVSTARLADAEEAFRMIRLRYESQLSSQLEVLDAQVALTAARMEEVSSRYDYLTAWDNLLRAMGTVQEIDS
jgi:outer membrane protein